MSGELNPPELAEAINAKGFMGAAGFRKANVGIALPLRRPECSIATLGNFPV